MSKRVELKKKNEMLTVELKALEGALDRQPLSSKRRLIESNINAISREIKDNLNELLNLA